LLPGLSQDIIFGEVDFELQSIKHKNLEKWTHNYYPMVISINYNQNGNNTAFLSYFVFNLGQVANHKTKYPVSTKMVK